MLNDSIKHLVKSQPEVNQNTRTITAGTITFDLGVPFDVLAEFLAHVEWAIRATLQNGGKVLEISLEKIVLRQPNPYCDFVIITYISNDFGLRWCRNRHGDVENTAPAGFPITWVQLAIEAILEEMEQPFLENPNN